MQSVTQQTAANAQEGASSATQMTAQANNLREITDRLAALAG